MLKLIPDIATEYSTGTFNPGEGIVASKVRITQDAAEVKIDFGGYVRRGTIVNVFPDEGLTQIRMRRGGNEYFDLERRRLCTEDPEVLTHGTAWPNYSYRRPDGHEAIIATMLRLVTVIAPSRKWSLKRGRLEWRRARSKQEGRLYRARQRFGPVGVGISLLLEERARTMIRIEYALTGLPRHIDCRAVVRGYKRSRNLEFRVKCPIERQSGCRAVFKEFEAIKAAQNS